MDRCPSVACREQFNERHTPTAQANMEMDASTRYMRCDIKMSSSLIEDKVIKKNKRQGGRAYATRHMNASSEANEMGHDHKLG